MVAAHTPCDFSAEAYTGERLLELVVGRKKMTLNQTWKNCLRMWKWIAKVCDSEEGRRVSIRRLKIRWMDTHMPDVHIEADCFFCKYNGDHRKESACDACPGKLVSRRFHCWHNVSYRYDEDPKKFYKKLLHLDAKRRK